MANCNHSQVPCAEVSAGCDALAWSGLLCRNCGQHVTPCLACSSPCALPRGRGSCIRCGALNPGAADANACRVLGLPNGVGLSSDLVRRVQEGLFGRRTHALFELQDYAALPLSFLPRTELKRKRGATTSPAKPIQSPLASQSTPSTSLPFLGHNATAQSPIWDPSASPACFMGGDSPGSVPGAHSATWEARARAFRLGAVINCLHCRATLEQDLGDGFGSPSLPVCFAGCSRSAGHKKRSAVLGSVDSCRLPSTSLTALRTIGGLPGETESLLVAVESLMESMEGSREGGGDARRARCVSKMFLRDRGVRGRKVKERCILTDALLHAWLVRWGEWAQGGSVGALLAAKVERGEQRCAAMSARCHPILVRINAILGALLTRAQSLSAPWEQQNETVERLRCDYRLWLTIYHFVVHCNEDFGGGT